MRRRTCQHQDAGLEAGAPVRGRRTCQHRMPAWRPAHLYAHWEPRRVARCTVPAWRPAHLYGGGAPLGGGVPLPAAMSSCQPRLGGKDDDDADQAGRGKRLAVVEGVAQAEATRAGKRRRRLTSDVARVGLAERVAQRPLPPAGLPRRSSGRGSRAPAPPPARMRRRPRSRCP